MKHIYNILSILCALCLFACTAEDETLNGGSVGYLRLTVGESNETTTKAANLPEGYTGLQIAVEIVDAEGETIEKTDDWEEWKGKSIQLKAGNYTIKAHSYGFDGKQSAMAAPYYYGSKAITIEGGKELNETVTCKLANVKMSVKVSEDIKTKFKSFAVSVDPKTAGACDPLTFNIDLSKSTISDTAYFPTTDLIVNYSATNKSNITNTAKKELTDVKGNDHYILNFTLADSVDVDDPVSVVVDPTMQTFTYTFYVSTTPTNNATVSANAWAKIAYLTATNVTATEGTDISSLKFQYRKQSTQDWTDAAATLASETYSGKTGALEASTTYECRMVNADESFATSPITFTTEAATELYNGGFDNWAYGTGDYKNTWFADFAQKQEGFNYVAGFNSSFWDSGNIGTSTGTAAMLGAKNPTAPEETIVHTSGGKAAKLESIYVVIQFAAGNIYTGNYQETIMSPMGARINWGQPFTSRPTALHGWIQYTPGTVNRGKNENLPDDATLHLNDTDQNAIYIALSDKGSQYEIKNGEKKFIDFDNDPNIIAYGELPQEECVKTDGWKEVNIPLVYRAIDRKPTHIIIVFSASKYGDYFVGSDKSVMYVDDFELVYDGEPTMWE